MLSKFSEILLNLINRLQLHSSVWKKYTAMLLASALQRFIETEVGELYPDERIIIPLTLLHSFFYWLFDFFVINLYLLQLRDL